MEKRIIFCLMATVALLAFISCNSPVQKINMNSDGIAIKGYDTVAYFTMGRPVNGDEKFLHKWNGARWLFSSEEHLKLFMDRPEKFAPKYGGY